MEYTFAETENQVILKSILTYPTSIFKQTKMQNN